ncbi:EF-hand domain-containing protein [Herminiimonas sp. NPDC097707]|uniref:EF-hand domain-containing protein n=1 Tax=Herminiimonas sp. NPDC097707 TaxID=3364007 RepID=UPI00383A738D
MHIKSIVLMAALLGNVAFLQPSIAKETRLNATQHSAPGTDVSRVESLTKPQAKAAKMFRVVNDFERIDANRDGRVTRDELRLYALSTRRHVPMT